MGKYSSHEEKRLIESIPLDEMEAFLARVKAVQKELLDKQLAEMRDPRRPLDPACPKPEGV